MKRTKLGALILFIAGMIGFRGALAQQQQQQSQDLPTHPRVEQPADGQVVQLCDGETTVVVKGVKAGERLTPEQAQAASNELMSLWFAKNDPAKVEEWKREIAAAQAAAQRQQKAATKPAAGSGSEQPNDFTARDFSVWTKEVEREVEYGNQIFHDDKLIESTNGVSCAMCHPNAANTHPETYPKFQIQLRRVALLRDMINWCIENPSRGKKLSADDPKMRALEAYIMAQRKGVAMEYGKH